MAIINLKVKSEHKLTGAHWFVVGLDGGSRAPLRETDH
jgi:hypothetical protein